MFACLHLSIWDTSEQDSLLSYLCITFNTMNWGLGMAFSSPDPGWILPGPFHQGRTWEQAFSHRTSSYPLSGGAESKLKASLSSKPRSVCRYYKTVQIGSCRSEILPSTSLHDPLKWPLPHLAGTGGGCAIRHSRGPRRPRPQYRKQGREPWCQTQPSGQGLDTPIHCLAVKRSCR